MQPLVLAIEPDHRQAAIVKRIVREKVLADVTVVDSRDAALEAMRTTIPDVLLLSALLSPRDEDEILAHLRTLRDAEHLQTHTIPQLASSIGDQDVKPSKGLLSAFRRKKEPDQAPAGCDPDLFAEEIRAYLKRAADKKKEVRASGGSAAPVAAPMTAAPKPSAPAATAAPTPSEPVTESSWDDPFAWRPTGSRSAAAPAAKVASEPAAPMMSEPAAPVPDPEPLFTEPLTTFEAPTTFDAPAAAYDPLPELRDEPHATHESQSIYRPASEPEPSYAYSSVLDDLLPADVDVPPTPYMKYPLTMRTKTSKGWWLVEGKEAPAAEPDSEMREVLAGLAVPSMIAGVAYAEGCRIRRVRLAAA